MNISEVTITDNRAEILAAMREQCIAALNDMGELAEGDAKARLTDQKAVDTGTLRNSITYEVDDNEMSMIVGSNVEYAPYVELGTGKYYPGGRPTPWMYVDAEGWYHWTAGMKARPYIKPAVENNVDKFKQILEIHLKE